MQIMTTIMTMVEEKSYDSSSMSDIFMLQCPRIVHMKSLNILPTVEAYGDRDVSAWTCPPLRVDVTAGPAYQPALSYHKTATTVNKCFL